MSIILEGPNGSGKSTFAKKLSEIRGIQVIHVGSRPEDREVINKSRDEVIAASDFQVFDRVQCVSHVVYDLQDALPLKLLLKLEEDYGVLSRHNHIIYFTGESETTDKDYNSDDHNKMVREKQAIIRKRYDDFFKLKNVLRYDFRTDNYDQFVNNFLT